MTDQAKTLRQLMARSQRIEHESSHAQLVADVADVASADLPLALGSPVEVDLRSDLDRLSTVVTQASSPTAPAHIALLLGGRSGVGTTTLGDELTAMIANNDEPVVLQDIESISADEITLHESCDLPKSGWWVVDGGTVFTDDVARLWRLADSVTVVTTVDAASVTGCYRMMKAASRRNLSLDLVHVIVNQVASHHEAERTGRRLKRCCKAFLGHSQRDLDWVAFEDRWGTNRGVPVQNSQKHDSDGGTFREPINRNVKNWADRVSFRPYADVGS